MRTDSTALHVCARCEMAVDPEAAVVHAIGADVVTYGHASAHDCIRLLRAAHERDLARAYWRGMLGGMATDAERESERSPKESFTWRSWRARARRLRAIAASEMWLPWFERKEVGT